MEPLVCLLLAINVLLIFLGAILWSKFQLAVAEIPKLEPLTKAVQDVVENRMGAVKASVDSNIALFRDKLMDLQRDTDSLKSAKALRETFK